MARLLRRIWYFINRHSLERELEREMAAHRAEMGERQRFGNVLRLREQAADVWGWTWVDDLKRDAVYALRTLSRAPGFAAAAVLTIALGVGANAAIFALADAVLLRPLPFPDSERLVLVEEFGPQQSGRSRIELRSFHEWRDRNRTFDTMAAMWIPADGGGPVIVGADGAPESVPAHNVTTEFFDVLGAVPIAGRTFRADDESTNPDVVVLSEDFWRRHLAADRAVIGRSIALDGRAFTIIGVVSAALEGPLLSFQFVGRPSIWTLLPLPRPDGTIAGCGGPCRLLQVIGRLKPDVSIDAARSDITALAEALAVDNGDTRRPRRVTVDPLRDVLIGRELRITSVLFLGVVGFVLLLCCANVANLLLTRASVRLQELAVRAALGAGRRRIAAQLLTESVVLGGLGGVVGLGLGVLMLRAAPAFIPPDLIPGVIAFGFDTRTIAACAAISVIAGLLVGLGPVWHVGSAPLTQAIGAAARISTGGGRLRSALVTAEVAGAVLVLCGAGLLLKTLFVLEGLDQGYRAARDSVLTANVTLPDRYSDDDAVRRFYDAVERELAGAPGIRSVAWATTLPLGGAQLGGNSFQIVGDTPLPDAERPSANYQVVSSGYFRTVDLPIVAGRAFTDDDSASSAAVCIVSEAFVARHLPDRNPLGVRLITQSFDGGPPSEREIVGVARQVKERPDELEGLVQIYVPNSQFSWREAYLLARTSEESISDAVMRVREGVGRVDRLVPVDDFMTLDDIAKTATGRYRFRATLVMAFAIVTVLLALIGVFGVVAYSVQQRGREFGVRMALGATVHDVVTLVLVPALRVAMTGAVIGATLAAAFSQALRTFLFGVQPLDVPTFAAAVFFVGAAAAAAAVVPALRVTRLDPAATFKHE